MGPVQVTRINEDELRVSVTNVFTEYLDHYILILVGDTSPESIVAGFLRDELGYTEVETVTEVEYVNA